MTDMDEPNYMLAALSRWRASCIFYFKFDLALVAATAAMISFFNIHGTNLVATAYEYKFILYSLILLIVYALFYELNITNTCNRRDLQQLLSNSKHRKIIYRLFSWGYTIQVLAHVILLVGALGFAGGYVDGFMAACHASATKCVGT